MNYKLLVTRGEYEPNLLKTLQDWNEQEHDVQFLTTEGETIGTNKLILSFYSVYLKNILQDQTNVYKAEIPTISIPASSSCLSLLINILIKGEAQPDVNEHDLLKKVEDIANILGITLNLILTIKQNLTKIKSEPDTEAFLKDTSKEYVKQEEKPVPKKLGPHCKDCEIIFKDVSYLNKHNRKKHGIYTSKARKQKDVKPSHSDITSLNMKKFVKSFESKIKPACERCSIEFKNIGTMRQHNRKIHGINVVKRRGTSEKEKCDLCESQFSKPIYLLRHKKNEHGNITNFRCASCPKSFEKIFLLNRHIQTHLPYSEKPFKCDICEKRFFKRYLRNAHMKYYHSYVHEFNGKYEEFVGKYADNNE